MVVASTLITMLFTTPIHAFVQTPRVIGPSSHAPTIRMKYLTDYLKRLPQQMHNKRHGLGEYASRGKDVIWISYSEAIFGTALIVRACTGYRRIDLRMPDVPWVELKVTVPPGTQPGDTIDASNVEPLYETETARAFKRNETARGFERSWYFEVRVQIPHPTELDEEELGFLKRIATMDALSGGPMRRITAKEKRGWRVPYRSSSALRRLRGGATPDDQAGTCSEAWKKKWPFMPLSAIKADTDVEARTLPGRIIRVLGWTMGVFCCVFLLIVVSMCSFDVLRNPPYPTLLGCLFDFGRGLVLHGSPPLSLMPIYHCALPASIVSACSIFMIELASECDSYLKHRRTMIQPKLPDATRSSSALP